MLVIIKITKNYNFTMDKRNTLKLFPSKLFVDEKK